MSASLRNRLVPVPPQRRRAVARAEQILDALDRLLLTDRSADVSLSAVAREAGIPLSSIYHLFPTVEAAYVGLVRRYNARMDADLESLLAGPLPASWQDLARVLLATVRTFYARHPVPAWLVLRTVTHGALRATDDAHIDELAGRLAAELERRFHVPHVPDLPRRLAIAMAISDRIWAMGLRDDGSIPEFHFEESARAVLSYLGNFFPPAMAPRTEIPT